MLKPLNKFAPTDVGLYKQGMRALCGAVNVIACEHEGERIGITVSAVTSLTVDPPQLLACVNTGGRSFELITKARAMSVNVLTTAQEDLAMRFAGMAGNKEDDHFAHADWGTMTTGAPYLKNALASFDCCIDEIFVTHTHGILIGSVKDVKASQSGAPLLYMNGKFSTLAA